MSERRKRRRRRVIARDCEWRSTSPLSRGSPSGTRIGRCSTMWFRRPAQVSRVPIQNWMSPGRGCLLASPSADGRASSGAIVAMASVGLSLIFGVTGLVNSPRELVTFGC
jgi:hypothetical protein